MARDAEQRAEQATRLKELRRSKRVSQETAAHEIGVSVRGYRNWESAESDPSGENLKATAKYYETTEDFIEFGVEHRDETTPDLIDAISTDAMRDQLARVEAKLDDVNKRLDELTPITPSQQAELKDLIVKMGQLLPAAVEDSRTSQTQAHEGKAGRGRQG